LAIGVIIEFHTPSYRALNLEISADAWMTPDDILEIGCCAGILHRILARAMCTDMHVAEPLGERTEGLAM
jgi:hypothetical protein